MKRLITFAIFILITSCGKNANFETPSDLITAYTTPTKDSISELTYTYELFESDCSTGFHEFLTLKETCSALLNDSLNRSCAKEEREKLYSISNCKA